jgi:hypothetical protein
MSTPQLTTVIDKAFLGRLCADAICNLERACENHPTFPGELSSIDIEIAQHEMYSLQRQNDAGNGNVRTIANEEFMEFDVAVLQGMPKQAYDELVDLITVWLRVGCHLTDYVHASGVELQPALQTFVAPAVSTRAKHETVPRADYDRAMNALLKLWSGTGSLRTSVLILAPSVSCGEKLCECLKHHSLYMKVAEDVIKDAREKEVKMNRVCPVDEEKCDLCAGVTAQPCPDAKATYTDETYMDKCNWENPSGDCFNPESAFVGQICPGCHRYSFKAKIVKVEVQP